MGDRTCYRNFIDGEFVDGPRKFTDVDPATGRVIADVCEASAEDVNRAVWAARAALRGPWGATTPEQRADVLRRISAGIRARMNDFILAEVNDTGKPLSLARSIDIPRGIGTFALFADLAQTPSGECFQTPTEDGRGALNYTLREPIGVVGAICPWNLPLLLLSWKVAPALAMGNCVVAKPSEETPGTATLLAEVMRDVGLPKGVFNLVHGAGKGATGETLVSHPGVDAVTFTGESATATAIQAAAASPVRSLSFELGGKNPALVFADCDFESAVSGVARSIFANTGQMCLCTERVYVERPLFERFVEGLRLAARRLRVGDPMNPETTLGPLISQSQRERVLSYYQLARTEGATVLTGGGVPELLPPWSGGFFVEPTLWVGLPESARCVREEIFGPVAHLSPFDDEDDAVQRANDSPYGLTATVWTKDVSRAHRVSARLDVGTTWINGWMVRDLRVPFGGLKQSGVGRSGGRHSLDFFSRERNICVKL